MKRRGDDLFQSSGTHVGRIRREKIFDTTGRYVGTIVGDRVIYRSTHSASISCPFAQRASAGVGRANRAGTGASGDEPPFPD